MGIEAAVSGIHSLLKLLENPKLKQILSIIDRETQLDALQAVATTIHTMLRKIKANQSTQHTEKIQIWIDDLRNSVYEAIVQLEKFIALAHQKQLLKADADADANTNASVDVCTTLSKKIRVYYYRFNRHGVPYKVFQVVNNVTVFLDGHANRFTLSIQNSAVDTEYRDEKEPSYYRLDHVSRVIGRDNDLENIMGILLDSNNEHDVSFLSIAGIGGVGKTTLAQLVFNDFRVRQAFSLRMWVSVSNHDQEELNVKYILDRILHSTTCEDYEISTMDQVQSLVRKQLKGKKYLLVLDDVWTEKPDQLHRLANCLIGGQRGSWIMITTRSRRTDTAIQDGQLYELQGLSRESSWQLFQMEAFQRDESNNRELNQIGKRIVDECDGYPLAIRVAGKRIADECTRKRILYGKDERNWGALLDIGLTNTEKNEIICTFRRSYNNLKSRLKSCFIYCAWFPKYFRINKDMLISLWMAQDYIDPLKTGVSSSEDVGEEYFSTLVDNFFFQDIKRDKYGEIVSCMLHHFIYDLAQQLAQGEIYIMSDPRGKLYEGAHHVSILGEQWIGYDFLGNTNIFSYFLVGYNNLRFPNVTMSSLELLLAKCRSLKALDLGGLFFESLPDSIGELSILRYLNLSGNRDIEVLPRTITKLQNLQTLNLQECQKLKELPKKISRLVNLRLLNIRSCSSLTCMPRGISKLTCLHKLSDFIASDEGSYTSWKEVFDALEDLKPLDNLQGQLNIATRCPNAKYLAKDGARRESIYPLRSKKRLKAIEFDFKHVEVDGVQDVEGVTRLMKELQPPSTLQYIKVWRYQGVRIDWNTFPLNLVQLVMVGCWELECLPCLGNLHNLKVLRLLKMKKLEYIRQDGPLANYNSYYPSLETLWLENLPMLKGWRKGAVDDHLIPCFSQLKSLFIWNCPQLTWVPPCPSTVEDLKLVNFNNAVRIIKILEGGEKLSVASTLASRNGIDIPECSSCRSYIPNGKNIKKVALSNVAWLNGQPMEAFKRLENLEIWCDKEVEILGEVEELFRSCSFSLKTLIIHNCSNLKSVVPGGLKHLIALEKLELRNCDNLALSEEERGGEEEREDSIAIELTNWSRKLHFLQTLKLEGLPQLVNLPNWMQFLPSLQCLCISYCNQLKSVPDWIPKITSLRQIIVHGCSASLEKRCREIEEDWPNIQFLLRNCVF